VTVWQHWQTLLLLSGLARCRCAADGDPVIPPGWQRVSDTHSSMSCICSRRHARRQAVSCQSSVCQSVHCNLHIKQINPYIKQTLHLLKAIPSSLHSGTAPCSCCPTNALSMHLFQEHIPRAHRPQQTCPAPIQQQLTSPVALNSATTPVAAALQACSGGCRRKPTAPHPAACGE